MQKITSCNNCHNDYTVSSNNQKFCQVKCRWEYHRKLKYQKFCRLCRIEMKYSYADRNKYKGGKLYCGSCAQDLYKKRQKIYARTAYDKKIIQEEKKEQIAMYLLRNIIEDLPFKTGAIKKGFKPDAPEDPVKYKTLIVELSGMKYEFQVIFPIDESKKTMFTSQINKVLSISQVRPKSLSHSKFSSIYETVNQIYLILIENK